LENTTDGLTDDGPFSQSRCQPGEVAGQRTNTPLDFIPNRTNGGDVVDGLVVEWPIEVVYYGRANS